MQFDPLQIDRELRLAARDFRRFRRALKTAPDAARTFALSPRLLDDETLQALRESADPLSPALLGWLGRLREQAAHSAILIARARAYRSEAKPLDAPLSGSFSLRAMLGRALAEPGARSLWLDAFLSKGTALASHTSELWAERAAFRERHGSEDDFASAELASEWLDLTADLFDEFRPRDLAALIDRALGADVSEGWPSRITARSIGDLLREARWFDGLSLDPEPLPETLTAASFLRALAVVGSAWAEAAVPQDGLFAISRQPYAERETHYAALFASLPLSPSFARRRLGLGSERIRAHLRGVARIVLFETRARAFRVLLRAPVLRGHQAFRDAFAEQGLRAFGFELPPKAAGVLWQPRIEDGQHFTASFAAAERSRSLTNEHDEDWFRNPRAVEELRARARALEPTATGEAMTAGKGTLLGSLKSALA